jgi:hypothetical protein
MNEFSETRVILEKGIEDWVISIIKARNSEGLGIFISPNKVDTIIKNAIEIIDEYEDAFLNGTFKRVPTGN